MTPRPSSSLVISVPNCAFSRAVALAFSPDRAGPTHFHHFNYSWQWKRRILRRRGMAAYAYADALRRESDSFLQVNDDGIAFLLADAFSEIRFDGQLMGAVSQSHERAAEWMAVDGAADLHQGRECRRTQPSSGSLHMSSLLWPGTSAEVPGSACLRVPRLLPFHFS